MPMLSWGQNEQSAASSIENARLFMKWIIHDIQKGQWITCMLTGVTLATLDVEKTPNFHKILVG